MGPCCTYHSFCQSPTEYVEKELDNYTAKEKLSFTSGPVFFSDIRLTIQILGSVTLPSTSMLKLPKTGAFVPWLVRLVPWEQINHKTINHKRKADGTGLSVHKYHRVHFLKWEVVMFDCQM